MPYLPYSNILPYFMDYKMLRIIKHTLIFKQYFKNIAFWSFLLLDCTARLKKILVYKTELTFKISENRIFFSDILY